MFVLLEQMEVKAIDKHEALGVPKLSHCKYISCEICPVVNFPHFQKGGGFLNIRLQAGGFLCRSDFDNSAFDSVNYVGSIGADHEAICYFSYHFLLFLSPCCG
jgi:hypothetical protein